MAVNVKPHDAGTTTGTDTDAPLTSTSMLVTSVGCSQPPRSLATSSASAPGSSQTLGSITGSVSGERETSTSHVTLARLRIVITVSESTPSAGGATENSSSFSSHGGGAPGSGTVLAAT